jgi:signal transduction histidine kinase
LLLIVLGLLGIPYILGSLTDPTLFGLGEVVEGPIYFMTAAAILAFPSGRIEGMAAKVVLAVTVIFPVVVTTVFAVADPHAAPGFSISGCRAACPANGLAIWSTPAWFGTLLDVRGVLVIAIAIATAGVLVWRFVTGTPPRRRALAIGAPIALLYLAMQASYRVVFFLTPDGLAVSNPRVHSALQWTFAAARSFVWYGFLFALIAAELFAGRTLRRLVGDSLGRPSLEQLEGMVRGPLGDPGLRLGFWRPGSQDWANADGEALSPPEAGQALTEVEQDGRPAVAIVHDKQLSEDPELLQAAGAVALLAVENAKLDAAWKASRARVVSAGERERRKLEQDLHDGAQQRLMAAQVRLSMASDLAADRPDVRARLTETRLELDHAIEELRDLAHGIYPRLLTDRGLVGAVRALAPRFAGRVIVTEASEAAFPPEIETAVYYCCLEAVQNAVKHAGPEAMIRVRLRSDARELRLEVRDDGPGFDTSNNHHGAGLDNMRDRINGVGGDLEIVSHAGHDTLVAATVPLGRPAGLPR